MTDESNIVELGAHERMSVSEALLLTEREAPSEVLILSVAKDGTFGLRSSGMSNKDALWLIEAGRIHVLKALTDD